MSLRGPRRVGGSAKPASWLASQGLISVAHVAQNSSLLGTAAAAAAASGLPANLAASFGSS